ncbi:MAG: hypothetical protein LBJ78_02885, partial [Puniceicoccales bacterium]|nr:hypothetical protein [Puniceicoccales bacterium]
LSALRSWVLGLGSWVLGLGSWVFTVKLLYPSFSTSVKGFSWFFGGVWVAPSNDRGMCVLWQGRLLQSKVSS